MARTKRVSTSVSSTFSRILDEQVAEKERQGMRQDEVARQIGISPSQLYDYRNDLKTPTIDTLDKICNYFDLTADYMTIGVKAENRDAAGYTGLSDISIETLHSLRASGSKAAALKLSIINSVLESDALWQSILPDLAASYRLQSAGVPLAQAARDTDSAEDALAAVRRLNEDGYNRHVLVEGEMAARLRLSLAVEETAALYAGVLRALGADGISAE